MEEEVKTEVETSEESPVEETTEEDDYTADIDESQDLDEEAEEFDLEYDEDGNIVIEDDAEEEGDTTPAAEEKAPAAEPAAEKEGEAARILAEFEEFKRRTRDALKSLGYDGEDSLADLEKVSAEAEGKTIEEYRAKMEEARRAEADKAARLDAQKKADLEAIKACIPTLKYGSVDEFPNFAKFADLCDRGVSPVDAFRASHPEDVAAATAAAVKQGARDSKAHLVSSVPRGAKDTSITLSRAEIEGYREMFPGMSDKDIVALYRKAKKG